MASSTTQNGTVPQVGSVGALYTIAIAQWQAINCWVAGVIQMQPMQRVVKPIPNYPALLAACQKWQAATEAGVFGQSAYVGLVAAEMVAALQNLQNAVSPGAPGDPLPPSTTLLYTLSLQDAASQAMRAAADLAVLAPDVAGFVAINQKVEAYLKPNAQEFGWSYHDAVEWLNTIGPALQELQAGWSSLIAQLQLPVPTTNSQELRTDVTSALAAWSALQQVAGAFDAQVHCGPTPPPGPPWS